MIRKFSTVVYKISKAREARMLQKLIDKRLNKPKAALDPPKILTKNFSPSAYENETVSRRMVVLNKLFMEKLSEMMNEVDCGQSLTDLKIEITKVKIHYTFAYIDIFWISQRVGTPDKIIKEILQSTLKQLQQKVGNISNFRNVPLLRFVRDVKLENQNNLEETFKLIDFGKDFDPAYKKNVCTPGFAKTSDDAPVMRQNILGLDVAEIKGRIMAQVNRHKAININTTEGDLVPRPGPPAHKLIQFNKKDFYKFYNRRRIEELKMRKKEESNYHVDEVYEPELWNMFDDVFEEIYDDINEEEEIDEVDEGDLIDEVDEEDLIDDTIK